MKPLKRKTLSLVLTIFSLVATTLSLSTLSLSTPLPTTVAYTDSSADGTISGNFGPHLSPTPEIYTDDFVFNTETYSDPFYEGTFQNGLNAKTRRIYMPRIEELSNNNLWDLFDTLIFKYFPEAYFHGYAFMYEDSNYPFIYPGYVLKDERQYWYFVISDDAYELMTDDALDEEYAAYIDGIIVAAGVNETMSTAEISGRLVRYLSGYTYNYDKFYELMDTGKMTYWKIPRDYGISICASDSRIYKSCMDRLNIPCRIVEGTDGKSGHMWNEVLIGDVWRGVDITGFRQYGWYYDNFDDTDFLDVQYIFR